MCSTNSQLVFSSATYFALLDGITFDNIDVVLRLTFLCFDFRSLISTSSFSDFSIAALISFKYLIMQLKLIKAAIEKSEKLEVEISERKSKHKKVNLNTTSILSNVMPSSKAKYVADERTSCEFVEHMNKYDESI
jgi:hypothetical protein